jgi:hypothetical protein
MPFPEGEEPGQFFSYSSDSPHRSSGAGGVRWTHSAPEHAAPRAPDRPFGAGRLARDTRVIHILRRTGEFSGAPRPGLILLDLGHGPEQFAKNSRPAGRFCQSPGSRLAIQWSPRFSNFSFRTVNAALSA